MKLILALFTLWSFQALATDTCSTAWVYLPYQTCGDASHGLNMSRPEKHEPPIQLQKETGPKADQRAVCISLRDQYNQANVVNRKVATLASPTPVHELKDKDGLGRVKYTYFCELNVTVYPFNIQASPACGTQATWTLVRGAKPNLGKAACLTCEGLENQPVENMVKCIKNSIANVFYSTAVKSGAIKLSAEDIKTLRARAQEIWQINQNMRILQNLDDIRLFSQFLKDTADPSSI